MQKFLGRCPRIGRWAIAVSTGAALLAAPSLINPAAAVTPSPFVVDENAPKVLRGVYDPRGAFGDEPGVAIEHIFMPWQEVDWATLRTADSYASSRGRELLISIEPWSWSSTSHPSNQEHLTAIRQGGFDSDIQAFCQATEGLESRVTIRWGHEMDDVSGRYAWAGLQPEEYIGAYRHFVDECRRVSPDAVFMWSPKGEATLAGYYPGDGYVDFVGITVFGLQAYDREKFNRDRSFSEHLSERYDRAAAFGKPVIVAELGFNGDANYMEAWAEEVACTDDEFPLLRGLVYFNEVETHAWPENFGKPDWRVSPDFLNRSCRKESAQYLQPLTEEDPIMSVGSIASTTFAALVISAPAAMADTVPEVAAQAMPVAAVEGAAEAMPVAATDAAPQAQPADAVEAAAKARPMTAVELVQVYGGKSWMWSDGAGYLAPDRRFLAWSGAGDTATYASGRWLVTDAGRMCFKAVWEYDGGSSPALTCFSHRKDGSTIYQRKEPAGEWYVFRHSDASVESEYKKLQKGDAVTANLSLVQAQLRR
ncbi:MAG: DUF995 domain-containing protein [Pseudomonadota bacterium]|nr:DUF995 domain-containing protein [Pseudomonadota bacterium]